MSTIAPFKVLFLCTGNSTRSIFAEYLLRKLGSGAFETFSAGSNPKGFVNPYTIRVLHNDYGIDASGARSKSVGEFRAASFDFVITVCDHAKESCPIWPKRTEVAHWSTPDPSEVEGNEEASYRSFAQAALQLKRRIDLLCSLPLADLDRDRRARLNKEVPAN